MKKLLFEVALNPPTVTSCQLRSPFPLQLLFGNTEGHNHKSLHSFHRLVQVYVVPSLEAFMILELGLIRLFYACMYVYVTFSIEIK